MSSIVLLCLIFKHIYYHGYASLVKICNLQSWLLLRVFFHFQIASKPQNFAADFLELPEDDRDKVLEVLEEAGDDKAVEVFMEIQDERCNKLFFLLLVLEHFLFFLE